MRMVIATDLISKITTTIKKHFMLSGEERIIIGLSGGPDSVCLLHVLHALKGRFMLDIHALYIDHGMRPDESLKEINFCRTLCNRIGIPFITKSIDVKSHADEKKMNIQEAARELRYQIFRETSVQIDAHKTALGHTADDQAETLLLRLFRGSGSTGLSGIPPIRENVIRPLIEIERKEIENFLLTEKIEFITDSSNLKKQYLRNKIRLSLIPMLKEINPDIIKTLSKTASLFRDEERYFEIIVTKTLMKLISRKTHSRIELFLVPFEIMDKVLMRRVLRRAIDETIGLRGINFIHIEDIVELIKSGSPGDRIYLPKGIRAIKEYSTLILTSDPPVHLAKYSVPQQGEVVLREAGIVMKASLIDRQDEKNTDHHSEGNIHGLWATFGIFDADKITFPLVVRSRERGDFFYPFGLGKRKKIQDFFVDEKIPRDERDRVPLLLSGQDIIWVVGYRGDDRFRTIKDTKKVLKIEIKKIKD